MQPIKNLLAPNKLLLLAILYSLVITIAFLIPGGSFPASKLPVDKIVHVAIHGTLLFIWSLYFYKKGKNVISKKVFFLVIAACFVYGIIIEVLQETLVALRHLDVMDLVANAVGIFLGIILFYQVKHYFKNQI
jgi:VanZ family protein